jgi:hypothetical protein
MTTLEADPRYLIGRFQQALSGSWLLNCRRWIG